MRSRGCVPRSGSPSRACARARDPMQTKDRAREKEAAPIEGHLPHTSRPENSTSVRVHVLSK